jgi:hypothetical protein
MSGAAASIQSRASTDFRKIPKEKPMISNRLHYAVAAALVAALALAGCKKKEEVAMTPPPVASEPAPMPPMEPAPAPSAMPVSVIAVDLGTAVGADNKVAASLSSFGAKDTIYASVTTDGTASNTPLAAKWTFAGATPMTVNEESKMLNTAGPATTEFHISKPDGFPVGKYKVEIMLNGAVVQSRDFEVK